MLDEDWGEIAIVRYRSVKGMLDMIVGMADSGLALGFLLSRPYDTPIRQRQLMPVFFCSEIGTSTSSRRWPPTLNIA